MSIPVIVVPADLDQYQSGDPQTLIEMVTADVRGFCNWHVTPSVTETITVDGSATAVQPLPSLHVTAVTSVTEDGVLLVVDVDYTWSEVGLLTRVQSWWTGKPRGVVVSLVHGYADASDLSLLILARVSRIQENPQFKTRTQAGPFSDQYEVGSGFTPDELTTLRRYRIPSST